MTENTLVKSYESANKELVAAFNRYLVTRGLSSTTLRSYNETLSRLSEFIGSAALPDVERPAIRKFLGEFLDRGLAGSTIDRHTAALRAFFKFAGLAGVTRHDPTLLMAHRKYARRLPVVLTIKEVESLINAATNPFHRAVAEVLYSTGVRVSELVNLRLDDILWGDAKGQPSSIRIHRGKGGKDRVVLFGRKAAEAIRAYQKACPSKAGFLFEAPARQGFVRRRGPYWAGHFYVGKVQHAISLFPGRRPRPATDDELANMPTRAEAEKELARIATSIPGFNPVPSRRYTPEAIRNVLRHLAQCAGLGRVHPHALRRAFASHMLVGGCDLRVLQDLLGHSSVSTTMLYTHLTAENLKEVHRSTHPHEQEASGNG